MKIWGDNFFSQQVLPGIYARIVQKKVSAFSKNVEGSTVENVDDSNIDKAITQIKLDIENQGERKKGLEDKVKAILFSVSISITAITFSLTYGKSSIENIYDVFTLIILLFSILYFIGSAMVSVNTLLPVPFRLVQTETTYDEKSNIISIVKEDKIEQYKNFVVAKYLNDYSNIKIANYTYASLKLLRNGIILFSLYFITSLIQKNFSNKIANTSIVINRIKIKVNDTLSINLPYSYESQSANDHLEIGKPSVIKTSIKKISKKLTDTTRQVKSN